LPIALILKGKGREMTLLVSSEESVDQMFITGIDIKTDKKKYLEKLELLLAYVAKVVKAKPDGVFMGMVKEYKTPDHQSILDIIVDNNHNLDEDQVDGVLQVLQYLDGEFRHPLANHRHHFTYHDEIQCDIVWDEEKQCYRQWIDTILTMRNSESELSQDRATVENLSAMSFLEIADGILYSWAFGQHDFASFRKDNISDYVNIIDMNKSEVERFVQVAKHSGVAHFYIRGKFIDGIWVDDEPDVNREAQGLDEIIFDQLTWK
jgi:hypothetical protein